MSHLRCENVSVHFGGVVACNNINLEVEEGKIVGLIGPNGAGKTTLFNVLSRFQEYDTGHVYYRDKSVDDKKPHEMINLGMARTFQELNLFKEQSTLDNLLIGAHHLIGNPVASMFSLPSARKKEHLLLQKVMDIAEILHLHDKLDILVKNLPYGFQKRVELARALASEPSMILLDEPVAGCNEEATRELEDIVHDVNQKLGVTFLVIEHDMSMVMKVCDYIYVINFGANLAKGTPSEVQANPDVIAAYLGQVEQ